MPTVKRVLVLALGAVAFMLVAPALDAATGPQVGANIGIGLLFFALLIGASAIWAFLDGRSGTPIRRLLLRWVIVAVAMGVVSVLMIFVREGGFPPNSADLTVLGSDLVQLVPFQTGLVLLGALPGAALGTASAPRKASSPA